MRRLILGALAVCAMVGVLLVLPVSSAPAKAPHPVKTTIGEVTLGSVLHPAEGASVTSAGAAPGGAGGSADAPGPPVPPSAAGHGRPLALTVSRPRTSEFSSVGVTWRSDASDPEVSVRFRVKRADGSWGDWTELQTDDEEQTPSGATKDLHARGGTAPYWTGRAYGIEAVVVGQDGVVPQDVRIALLNPGSSAADAAPEGVAPPSQAHAGTSMPAIISRADWGADESIRAWDPEYSPTIKAAALHHTDDTNNYTAADVPRMVRAIYAYHTLSRNWGDIGYNFLVDKFGRIFEGRYGGMTSTVIGAHTGGFNYDTFGVSLIGDYGAVDPPAPMLDAVASVVGWKFGLYGVDPHGSVQLTSAGGGTAKYPAGEVVTLPALFGHRDTGKTTCPGNYAYARLPQLRDMVARKMAGVGGSPTGNLENLALAGKTVSVAGWAFDPDYPPGAVDVDVLVDGAPVVGLQAFLSRPDVGTAYPAAGAAHGFSGRLSLSAGTHSVCVVALNAAPSGLNNWLGCATMTAAPSTADPFGSLDRFTLSGRVLTAIGWAIDADAQTSPVTVQLSVNGSPDGSVTAQADRPDVGAAYPTAGGAHGYTASASLPAPGNYSVCLTAVNLASGTDSLLGCRGVSVDASAWNPTGNADSVTVDGHSATVTGWAFDPDAPTAATTVHVYIDGAYVTALLADRSRPDVGQAFPDAGPAHGYVGAIELTPGDHTVCTYAINTGYGTRNPALGCRRASVAPATAWNPVGNLDTATISDGVVKVAGWSFDPDQPAQPVTVHLYVDGEWAGAVTATQDRPDVGQVFSSAGSAHGFSTGIPVVPGQHQVCAYAINTGYGTTNPLLACRTVTG